MRFQTTKLLPAISAWLQRTSAVKSAVLFGSSASSAAESSRVDEWSDLDLHVIATDATSLEHIDWAGEVDGLGFCMQVVRPATGGVRKISALFVAGQVDLVVVPLRLAQVAKNIVRFGLHRKLARTALNEMATCLHTGYRFLKGEESWGNFYGRVASEMPGVRMEDAVLVQSANGCVFDFLWVLQKIDRGELIAAQHLLHRGLVEANLRLLRELRLRCKKPVPSFGLGRRIERLCAPAERQMVETSASLEGAALHAAAWDTFEGLQKLMKELVPSWTVPSAVSALLSHYRNRKV